MGKRCSYGTCNSDSRYKHSVHMEGVVLIPFPKPHKNYKKCRIWVNACGRKDFMIKSVKRWSYICSKHFIGGAGPTPEHPDPIPAHSLQTQKCEKRKKLPRQRSLASAVPPSEPDINLEGAGDVPSAADPHLCHSSEKCEEKLSQQRSLPPAVPPSETNMHIEGAGDMASAADSHLLHSPQILEEAACEGLENTASLHMDAECQTQILEAACEGTENATVLHMDAESQTQALHFESKEVQTNFASAVAHPLKHCESSSHHSRGSNFSYETLSKDSDMFHFYAGITVPQFEHLYTFICDDVKQLNYWCGNKKTERGLYSKVKLSSKDQLLLTLTRLHQAFPSKDLAYRFELSESTTSKIINTWIQFLYEKTAVLRKRMFPTRQMIKQNLPSCFSSFKNVRVIIDCFEIFVQQSRNFHEQGNLYSNYKNSSTFKVLVGIAPCGAITFVSNAYEGSISDKDLFVRSGLLNLLDPGDLVIADRGFDILDILQAHGIQLNIPPFLNKREKLTSQEEMTTKRIARARIHVERAIERMKKFKIIGHKLPLSMRPVITQIVSIIGFLVNYQGPLVN